MKNIEEKMENIKPKTLSSAEKHILWAKIESNLEAKGGLKHSRRPATFFGVGSKFAIGALSVIVVLGSTSVATVAAANKAKPGDALFPLDIAIERIQLALTTKEEAKAKLRVRFSEERVQEAEEIVASADSEEGESTSTEATSTDENTTSTENPRFVGIELSEHALDIALMYLEDTRVELEAKGDTQGVAKIDALIEKLNLLAQNHVNKMEEVRARIEADNGNDNGLKLGIEKSSSEIKTRFRLDWQEGIDASSDEGNDGSYAPTSTDSEVKGSSHSLGIYYGLTEKELCHNSTTIDVAWPSVGAHLKQGDTLGPCDPDIERSRDKNQEEVSGEVEGTSTTDWSTSTKEQDRDRDRDRDKDPSSYNTPDSSETGGESGSKTWFGSNGSLNFFFGSDKDSGGAGGANSGAGSIGVSGSVDTSIQTSIEDSSE